MFKWTCLGVAVVALSAYGWILNDMRLEVKGLVARADQQLPRILTQAERVTEQLDTRLPKLLTQSETAAANLDKNLPALLQNSEQAVVTLKDQLPRLLASSEAAVDSIAQLSDGVGEAKSMMSVVHSASQDKGLFSYGSDILSFLGDQPATIGVKKTGSSEMKAAVPAKDWASSAKKNLPVLSVATTSKTDFLSGLARAGSAMPWHIQFGKDAPIPLADWVKAKHPGSKDVK